MWNDGTIVAAATNRAVIVDGSGQTRAIDGWSDYCGLDAYGARMACLVDRELQIIDLRDAHTERVKLNRTYRTVTWVGDRVMLMTMSQPDRPVEIDPAHPESTRAIGLDGNAIILGTSRDGATILGWGMNLNIVTNGRLVAQIDDPRKRIRAALCGQRALIIDDIRPYVDSPLVTGLEIRTLPNGELEAQPVGMGEVSAVACTPNGIAVGSSDGRVALFDDSLTPIATLDAGTHREISALGASRNGKLVVSAHRDGSLVVRRL